MVIDNFAFVDMRILKNKDKKVFPNADWFWKVESDPEIRKEKLKDNWKNIDYILLTHEMVARMKTGELSFLKRAFENSILVKDFPPKDLDKRDVENFYSETGDWAALYKVGD